MKTQTVPKDLSLVSDAALANELMRRVDTAVISLHRRDNNRPDRNSIKTFFNSANSSAIHNALTLVQHTNVVIHEHLKSVLDEEYEDYEADEGDDQSDVS